MAEFRIGNNLHSTTDGRYFTIETGKYNDAQGKQQYGRYKNFVQSPTDALSSRVNQIYDSQQQSRLNQLKAQREKAIGQINLQKQQTGQQFQQARNQADVVNMQGVQRLRELMANNGLTASGENITAQANANSQRQNSLNQLNVQEQNQMGELNQKVADINNPAEEQAIIGAIQAERARALFDAQQQGMQQTYQRERDWKADQRYEQDMERDEQRYKQDAARDEQRYQAEKAWREYTFKNMSASQKQQLDWAKAQYGEDAAWRMFELQYQGELQKSMNQSQLDFYNQGFLTP